MEGLAQMPTRTVLAKRAQLSFSIERDRCKPCQMRKQLEYIETTLL